MTQLIEAIELHNTLGELLEIGYNATIKDDRIKIELPENCVMKPMDVKRILEEKYKVGIEIK